MSFIEELRWRGLIHDMIPGTEEKLAKAMTKGYIGFDPTSDSLHVGSMLQLMILTYFQRAGHQPIALIGGATGMVGDPSGKSDERNLLDAEQIEHNIAGIRKQLEQFLDFEASQNPALIVNNYDWYKDMNVLEFLRDVGKHITVSYMNAKDSVKRRLETGLSFTEYSYQLLQGYDFYWLFEKHGCEVQMGGSDQWGNITTGVEFIRRKAGGDAYAVTVPLVTKADGSKFGKTESGNVWLDPEKTSPYEFYQYWRKLPDEEAIKCFRIFTLHTEEEVVAMEKEHAEDPGQAKIQQALAEDITIRVHGAEAYDTVVKASQILFGNATKEVLQSLSDKQFLEIFKGVPQAKVGKDQLSSGIGILDFLAESTDIVKSKGEARRAIQGGGVRINKEKVDDIERQIGATDLLNEKFIIINNGRRNFYLVTVD